MNKGIVRKHQIEFISLFIMIINAYLIRIRFGEGSIGYFLAPLFCFEVVWVIFGNHISDALGRMLRARYAKGQSRLGGIIWSYTMYMQMITGIIGALLIGFLGRFAMTNWFHLTHGFIIPWIYAALFFLRMISETYSGYIAGRGSDIIGGFAAVIRQIIILVLGFFFSYSLNAYGKKVSAFLKQDDFASVYGVMGILIAAVIAEGVVIILMMIFRYSLKRKAGEYDDFSRRNDSTGNIFLDLWSRRILDIPGILAIFIPIPIIFGLYIREGYTNAYLAKSIGHLVCTVIIPAIIFVLMGYIVIIPIAGKVALFIRRKEMRSARFAYQTGFHMCCVYGIFGGAYVIALGNTLAPFLAPDDIELVNTLYNYAAFCIVFALIAGFGFRLLMSYGLSIIALPFQILGMVALVVVSNIFIQKGLPIEQCIMIGLLVSYLIKSLGISLYCIFKLDLTIDPYNNLLIPFLCGAICGVVNLFVSKGAKIHLGNPFTAAICFIEMIVVYTLLLLVFRNLKEKEIEYMPFGKIIMALGQMLHVL